MYLLCKYLKQIKVDFPTLVLYIFLSGSSNQHSGFVSIPAIFEQLDETGKLYTDVSPAVLETICFIPDSF